MWIILFIHCCCPTRHSYQMKWTIFLIQSLIGDWKEKKVSFFPHDAGGSSLFKVCLRVGLAGNFYIVPFWSNVEANQHITPMRSHMLLCFHTAPEGSEELEMALKKKMAYHSTVTDEPSPRERFFSFLLSLCHSRCVGICFPAISRCCRATLMCLTSCGHKTLSKIGSSKALSPPPFF